MDYKSIAEQIIALKNADLAFRDQLIESKQLGKGYHPQMEALHIANALELEKIIDTIGYPTSDKVGRAANEATWLLIQHSISLPSFMKKCLKLLEETLQSNQAERIHFAYLSDRIASFSGQVQLYGTQFDWDKNGLLSPNPYDDLTKVNQRRKTLGLNNLEVQTQIIRQQALEENQLPPIDLDKRNREMNEWKKKVGWIK